MPSRAGDSRWWEHEPTRPVRVQGGIRARTKRGAIGRSWWSGRFLEGLESAGLGGRLDRGRAYARAGQVLEMEITAGSVRATVQGSRPRPYQVRIGLVTYGKTEWARIEQAMADSAWYAAKLLAGQMPPDIEEVFAGAGLALFPTEPGDLAMDCGCPDQQVPCKHLAAVCYLLAESFDDDPFAILALRGRDRETLLDNVRSRRAGTAEGGPAEPPGSVPALADCLERYFAPAGEVPVLGVPVTPPDAVLDQYPPIGLRPGGTDLRELLRPVYRALVDPDSGPASAR